MNSHPGRVEAIEYQKELELDGEIYTVVLLPPSQALKLSVKLTKLIGEPMAQMAAAGQGKSLEEVLPMAVRALLARMDEADTVALIKEIVGSCYQKNQRVNFEAHFQGKLGHLIKLVGKVMEIQFADFFSGLSEMLGQAMGKMQG